MFPGAVPRSFIGPLLLSVTAYPILLTSKLVGVIHSSAHAALVLRLTLSTLYASSLLFFSYRIFDISRPQRTQRRVFLAICILQFHPLFWAGRTTPNGIVTPIVNIALALIFSKRGSNRGGKQYYVGLALLTVCQVIARMELVGMVIPVAVIGLLLRKAAGRTYIRRFGRIAIVGTMAASIGAGE